MSASSSAKASRRKRAISPPMSPPPRAGRSRRKRPSEDHGKGGGTNTVPPPFPCLESAALGQRDTVGPVTDDIAPRESLGLQRGDERMRVASQAIELDSNT